MDTRWRPGYGVADPVQPRTPGSGPCRSKAHKRVPGTPGTDASRLPHLYLRPPTYLASSPGQPRRHVSSGHMITGAGRPRETLGVVVFYGPYSRVEETDPTSLSQSRAQPAFVYPVNVSSGLLSKPNTSFLLGRALGLLVSSPVAMQWSRAVWPAPPLSPRLRASSQRPVNFYH